MKIYDNTVAGSEPRPATIHSGPEARAARDPAPVRVNLKLPVSVRDAACVRNLKRGVTLPSLRRVSFLVPALFFISLLIFAGFTISVFADGTRTWEQSKFDDLAKGSATGVAIRSAGGLELAPSFKL